MWIRKAFLLCKGIDDIPTVTPEIRDALYMQFETEGLAPILAELKEADPVHYEEVDRNNYKRVIHAVEICRMTGKPYSSFRTNIKKERPFRIIKVGLNRDRDELCDRINQRIITCTFAFNFFNLLTTSQTLYTAIPPLTPITTVLPFNIIFSLLNL